ncbi:metallophosphoesterase [Paenibacillus sp. CF384]|uniref:metallophosphoesterase n=1 Tax=Paenibacillus sp. CF384 TaxID=1884382 RepID=UPI0008985FC1|nr:metallophosphoesterase [Paenibacillus sp. CF384]SDX07981.1 Predicted phosphohydrolase, MPP superfamily [Paenibacillus sp. CF384]
MLIIGSIAVLLLLSIFIQTYWLKYSHCQLGEHSDTNLTIVQLSDLHGRTGFINGSLSQKVNRMKPDIVVITGDLVSRKKQLAAVLKEVQKIDCPQLFFVPGNYERECMEGFRKRSYSDQEYEQIIQRLQNQNISVLTNHGATAAMKNQKVLIYGFDNSIYGNESLTMTREEMSSFPYIILLAHSPSIIKLIEEQQVPYDLLLVGHTHGGQIRFLNRTLGAYKNYHVGLKRVDERRNFFITRGLGTVKIPIRLACSPEIAVFHIGLERKVIA